MALVGCGRTGADSGLAMGSGGTPGTSTASGGTAGTVGTGGTAGVGGVGAAAGDSGVPPPTGDTLWGVRGDGNGAVRAVAVAKDGRVVAAGVFSGTMDFGVGAMTSAGGNDIFVVSYDAQGTCLWSERFGGTKDDAANAVGMDENGAAYVSGAFMDSMTVGSTTLSSVGGYDVPLIVLNASGAVVGANSYGSASSDFGFHVDVRNGVVALIGASGGPITFGGSVLTGVESSFVVAQTTAGAHVFSRIFDELSIESVAIDATGHVAIGGSFNDTTDLGTGPITPKASTDGFVARLSPTGDTLFTHPVGDGKTVSGYAVATSATGDVVFGGMATAQGAPDSFVQLERVTASGTVLWSKQLGTADYAAANALAIDASGGVILAGLVRDGVVDLGCGPHTIVKDEAHKYAGDVLVAKLDPSGACMWSKNFGPTHMQFGSDVVVDSLSRVYVGGYFQGSIDFGSGPVNATHPSEPFVLSLAP